MNNFLRSRSLTILILIFLVLNIFLTLNFSFAQQQNQHEERELQIIDKESTPPAPIQSVSDVNRAFKYVRNTIFGIGMFLGVIYLIYAGILFITSAGEPEKINKARTALTWGLVGIAVAVVATGLIELIRNFFV